MSTSLPKFSKNKTVFCLFSLFLPLLTPNRVIAANGLVHQHIPPAVSVIFINAPLLEVCQGTSMELPVGGLPAGPVQIELAFRLASSGEMFTITETTAAGSTSHRFHTKFQPSAAHDGDAIALGVSLIKNGKGEIVKALGVKADDVRLNVLSPPKASLTATDRSPVCPGAAVAVKLKLEKGNADSRFALTVNGHTYNNMSAGQTLSLRAGEDFKEKIQLTDIRYEGAYSQCYEKQKPFTLEAPPLKKCN